MLTFVALTIGICFYTKRAIKYLEHLELKPVTQKAREPKPSKVRSRVNPYTGDIENDDGLSYEGIDFLESDIFDE